MTTDELEQELADDLKEDARENIALEEGTDEEKRDKSMENIAHSIAKAIKNGEVSLKKATPKELNELSYKDELVLWLVDGNGVLAGQPPLSVTDKDIVRWDETRWTLFASGGESPTPTIDAYTKAETDALVASSVSTESSRAQAVEASLSLAIRSIREDASGKADKVVGATNGHLAGLDSTGNLVDSGYSGSDFATAAALASEVAARENADATLQGNIDAEANARESADDALGTRIDNEATAREDADATLQSNIESEATEREQADGELQAQIDAISSKSDVVDVVASYVELVAYDTSALGDNDVIKVLEDETHDDAESYYRWSLTTQTWGSIGSQGPYYTISETDTLLAGKAPTNHASTATTYGVGDATKYGHVKVDSALSGTSTNPVQNKAVKSAVDGLQSTLDNCVKPCAVISDSGGDYTVWVIKTKVLFLADANVSTPLFIRLVGASYDSKNIDIQISSYRNPYNSTSGDYLGFTNLSGSFVPQIYEDYYTGDDGKLYKRFYIVSSKHSYRVYVYAWFQSSRHIGSSSLDGWTVEYSNTAPVVGENFCVRVTEYSSISARQLLYSRTLKVNLATESAQWFNGSADAESIGVSGTLPITHGGTGATTAAAARTNLGLGNVENESVSDGTPDFTEATARTNIASGEKMSTLFGKIKKWFTDLKTVAFTGSYNDLVDKPTIPTGQVQSDWNETGTSEPSFIKNKPQNLVQDASYVHTDNNYSTSEKNKLAGIETGAQVNNIFVAVYTGNHNDAGNTPYADIYAAYQAGKRLMCWNGNSNARRLYALNGFNATDKIFKFTACGGDGESILEVSFAYMEGNINDTECRTNNYLLAKRNHASSDTTYGTGSSSNYGHVKLSASTSSTSGVSDGVAATPSAVKAVKDTADSKYSIPSGGIPYNDMSSGVKASLDKADSALQQQDISGKLDKTGDGKDVTVTFTEPSSMTNVVSGEQLSLLFGKVNKWFSNLKYLAFQESVTDDEISGTISDSHIASASTWNGKAPRNHASSSNMYGQGTSDNFGHVMLSDSIQNWDSSQGYAATPKAVKAAYDLANGKADADGSNASGIWGGIVVRNLASSKQANSNYGIKITLPADTNYWNTGLTLVCSKGGHTAIVSIAIHKGRDAAPSSLRANVTCENPSNSNVPTNVKYKTDSSGNTTIYVWTDAGSGALQFSATYTGTDDGWSSMTFGQELITSITSQTLTSPNTLVYSVMSSTTGSVGSADNPAFVNSSGIVTAGKLFINRGSHSTVTMDFTGTLGSNADTWYLT